MRKTIKCRLSMMRRCFFLHLIDLMKPKKMLEIGTAIGFCAISIATYDGDILIDSIEKNETLFSLAVNNVRKAKLDDRINLFLGDAAELELEKLNLNTTSSSSTARRLNMSIISKDTKNCFRKKE